MTASKNAFSSCQIAVFYSYWFRYNSCCCFCHVFFVICFVILVFCVTLAVDLLCILHHYANVVFFLLLLFSFDGNFRWYSSILFEHDVSQFSFFSCNNINGCHHLNPSFMCCTTLFELFPCLLHFVFAYYLLTTQLHLYIIVLKYFSPKLHMLIVNDYILARILNF